MCLPRLVIRDSKPLTAFETHNGPGSTFSRRGTGLLMPMWVIGRCQGRAGPVPREGGKNRTPKLQEAVLRWSLAALARSFSIRVFFSLPDQGRLTENHMVWNGNNNKLNEFVRKMNGHPSRSGWIAHRSIIRISGDSQKEWQTVSERMCM